MAEFTIGDRVRVSGHSWFDTAVHSHAGKVIGVGAHRLEVEITHPDPASDTLRGARMLVLRSDLEHID